MLSVEPVVCPVDGNRVVPDVRRHLHEMVQVPLPRGPHELELEGLTHSHKRAIVGL